MPGQRSWDLDDHRFDPRQFTCRANRSMEDAIATALHFAQSHLEQQGSYAWVCCGFQLDLNTILPNRLVTKLSDIGVSHFSCLRTKDFLPDRSQRMRMPPTPSAFSLSTSSPQGYVLRPLLYTLYTHSSNSTIKFADDTTVVGLISGGDESAYQSEVEQLSYKDSKLIVTSIDPPNNVLCGMAF